MTLYLDILRKVEQFLQPCQKKNHLYDICIDNCVQFNELNKDGTYTVTFDPIDGSLVIDSNFSVASIFAVWQTKDINGQTGKDLVGAGVAIYGSRTTMVLYNAQSKKVEELTLLRMGKHERWIVTNPDLKIKPDAKLFSPALKSSYD